MKGTGDGEPQGHVAQKGLNVLCVSQNNFHILEKKATKDKELKKYYCFHDINVTCNKKAWYV